MTSGLASRTRPYFHGALKLLAALAMLAGGIAAYRFALHPLVESAFHLDPATSSLVRRFALLAVQVLAYWAFVHFVERRRATLLEYPEATEEAGFKGTMTLLGCSVMWAVLAILIVSASGRRCAGWSPRSWSSSCCCRPCAGWPRAARPARPAGGNRRATRFARGP